MKTKDELIDDLLNLAFAEDVGDGDHTTLSTIPAEARGKSRLLIKEEGILSGVNIARQVLAKIDPELKMEVFINDGTRVIPAASRRTAHTRARHSQDNPRNAYA